MDVLIFAYFTEQLCLSNENWCLYTLYIVLLKFM